MTKKEMRLSEGARKSLNWAHSTTKSLPLTTKFSPRAIVQFACNGCQRHGARLAIHVRKPGAGQSRICRNCWLAAIATETRDAFVARWHSLFGAPCPGGPHPRSYRVPFADSLARIGAHGRRAQV